jgi:hypothetical protein
VVVVVVVVVALVPNVDCKDSTLDDTSIAKTILQPDEEHPHPLRLLRSKQQQQV